MDGIEAMHVEISFEEGGDVGTDEPNLVMMGAICRWQERRDGL